MKQEENLTLYQISNDLVGLFELIEENEGEITPEIQELLEIREEGLNDKAVKYERAICYLESQEKLLDDRIKRLSKLKKQSKNGVDRLKGALLQSVLLFGEQDKPTKSQKANEKFGVEGVKRLTIRGNAGEISKLSNRQTLKVNLEVSSKELPDEYQKIILPKLSKREFNIIIESLAIIHDSDDSSNSSILNLIDKLKINEVEEDKTLIKKDILDNKEIEGVKLVVSHSLNIK